MFRFKAVGTLVWICCLAHWSHATLDPIRLSDTLKEEHAVRGKYIEVFEDTSNSVSFEDIVNGNYDAYFLPSTHITSFDYIKNTAATYWIRFRIQGVPPLNRYYVLENSDLHIDSFRLYKPLGGKYQREDAGFRVPFGIRHYAHKNFVFDIHPDTSIQTYYLRVQSRSNNPFILKVRSTIGFVHYALNEYYLLGMFYGILAIMALYNLLMFFSLRDTLYLYYVGYVVCCGLIAFGEDGIGFHYLWPTFPLLNTLIAKVAPLLLMLSFAVYARKFLELKRMLPRFDLFLQGVLALYLVLFGLSTTGLSLHLDFPLYIFPFLMIYISAFVVYRKGLEQARYFVLGYSFMMLSIALLILRMGGFIHWDSIITVYSFNIGIVFEIIMLSLALGDRIRIIRAENERNTQLVIEQFKINEKLKDELNRDLEAKVAERTIQLEEKNLELKVAYDEIQRINQLLDADNKDLKKNVKELTKARVLLKDVNFEEFSRIFPDKEACLSHLTELKWAKGYVCKKCGNEKWCKGKDDYAKRCTKCRYDESATAYTIFHKLKFPITKAFYMLFLLYANKQKITSLELSEILDLRQSTCWSFSRKIIEMQSKSRKKGADSASDGWSSLVLDPEGQDH